MIKLFTIGFTEKSAETFFSLLKKGGVKKILDVRLNNVSQLAGFAKGRDLKYFAKEIANIDYEHNIDLAPPEQLLSDYRNKIVTWDEYQKVYIQTLDDRNIIKKIEFNNIDGSCLLCSEHKPDKCHRRLLAEYLHKANTEIEIIHLIE